MVETSFDIRFDDDGGDATVESNASGALEQQAELAAFTQLAARMISLLGQERALPIAGALTRLELEALEDAEPSGPSRPSASGDGTLNVLARFVNGRGGPRMFFRLKRRGLPPLTGGDGELGAASVLALLDTLLRRRAEDEKYIFRLAKASGCIGRLGALGRIAQGNEFAVSLAAADVGWRATGTPDTGGASQWEAELQCPACGNVAGFDYRLWPSDRAAIRGCGACGRGLWLRAGRRTRLLGAETWSALEALRGELSGTASSSSPVSAIGSVDGEGNVVFEDLKRLFVQNGWPFSEVRGAPVLLSELSGGLGRWKFYAHVVDEHALVLLYSVCPLRVPRERREEVSQFLTRANYGLAAGNFELDFEDGEIRYKTALQLQGEELDGIMLKRLVRANGIAMETYLPGIGAVIAGTSALSALERRTNG